jgi:hypothetical protein
MASRWAALSGSRGVQGRSPAGGPWGVSPHMLSFLRGGAEGPWEDAAGTGITSPLPRLPRPSGLAVGRAFRQPGGAGARPERSRRACPERCRRAEPRRGAVGGVPPHALFPPGWGEGPWEDAAGDGNNQPPSETAPAFRPRGGPRFQAAGVQGRVLSVAEGPVLSVAEGPVLSVAEGRSPPGGCGGCLPTCSLSSGVGPRVRGRTRPGRE